VISDEDQKKIDYVEMMHKLNLPDEMRQNLLSFMNMGFTDFQNNLKVLNECNNNMDKACIKIMGLSGN